MVPLDDHRPPSSSVQGEKPAVGGMAKRTAVQLTVTIPDGAPAGSILSIPVNGKAETIKARVPEGLGPGSTLVLTQWEGSDEWTEEAPDRINSQSIPVVPGAVVGLDLNGSGQPDLIVAGPDIDRDGIPDALQNAPGRTGSPILAPGMTEPLPQDPGLIPSGPVAYTVRLDTSAGILDIIVRPDWAPHGARRFLELAATGDLDGLTFYRAVKGCLAQFGLPAKRQWQPLPDDPPTGVPFLLGAVCFAAIGKNSRKSTLFICIGDMSHCFGQSPWETPIGAVAEASLDVLDRIETVYGDIAECGGGGPNTSCINSEGDEYLRANFPLLTRITTAEPLDWPSVQEQGCSTQTAGAQEPVTSTSNPVLAVTEAVNTVLPSARGQEPSTTVSASNHEVSSWPTSSSSGPTRIPSASRLKPRASEFGYAQTGPTVPGLPIDVPVEVVPSAARRGSVRSRGNLTARAAERARGGSLVLDVPVEVCSSRPSSKPTRGIAGIAAKTARSSSSMRVQPVRCDMPRVVTPSQGSASFVVGGAMSMNASLNRSHSTSFERQLQVQAQAHRQPRQLHGLQGQPFAPTLGSGPLGSMPLGYGGSGYGQCLDGSFAASPLRGGVRGLQGPFHSPPHHQLGMAGALPVPSGPGLPPPAQLQPPMSPLGMLGGCSPCSPSGLMSPPMSLWNQR